MKHRKLLILLAVVALLLLLAYCSTIGLLIDTPEEITSLPGINDPIECSSDSDCTRATCGTSRGINHGLIYRETCQDSICRPSGSEYCASNEECASIDGIASCKLLEN
jgi:hypothetical protein